MFSAANTQITESEAGLLPLRLLPPWHLSRRHSALAPGLPSATGSSAPYAKLNEPRCHAVIPELIKKQHGPKPS